jgi:hypothetical protein
MMAIVQMMTIIILGPLGGILGPPCVLESGIPETAS